PESRRGQFFPLANEPRGDPRAPPGRPSLAPRCPATSSLSRHEFLWPAPFFRHEPIARRPPPRLGFQPNRSVARAVLAERPSFDRAWFPPRFASPPGRAAHPHHNHKPPRPVARHRP